MKTAYNLLTLAYDDYIGGRVLLNNGNAIQGATLASTSLEKYLKAMLVILGNDLNKIKIHLDKLNTFISLFSGTAYSELFTQHFDDVFFDQLSKAFLFRYYDNLKEPTTIGFFINQFLCELDHTVAKIEHLIVIKDSEGRPLDTSFKRACKRQDKDLILNNFLFLKIPKEDFMKRETDGYALHFDPERQEPYTISTTVRLPVEYNGKIMPIIAEVK